MSDRAQAGLRGPVKSCIEENTLPPVPDVPERSSEIRYRFTRTYDPEGHELSTVHGNSDGSQWISRNQYDTSGQLLKDCLRNRRQGADRNDLLIRSRGQVAKDHQLWPGANPGGLSL